jgi:Ran GTPase-activating protein (RanGAP) involved in mRNA processing and transport
MLKTNKTLIFLGLSFNQITDRGVQYLTNAIANHNKTLQWLHLASNKGITDVSVEYIKDMFKRNQSLQALWLNDCSLSAEAAKTLKKMVESNTNFILEV